MAKNSIGERIKAAREKKGLTRAEFATAVEVTHTAAWNWEEKGMAPRKAMLAKIAKVLGVSEKALKGGTDTSSVSDTPNTIDEILAECRRQLAIELKVPSYRVKVTMELVSE